MGFSNFISSRYYGSKSKWSIVNIISRSASFVLTIAVCSFFVVLSVFSGLKNFGANYSKAFDPEIKISSLGAKHFIIADSLFEKIKRVPEISFVSKVLEEKILVQNEENNGFAYLIGVDESYNSVLEIDSVISVGKWLNPSLKNLDAVVSYDLADKLNLGLFNYGGGLTILVPSKNSRNNLFKKAFSSTTYMVSGVFSSSEASDQKTVFTSISSARKLLSLENEAVSSIIIKITSKANALSVLAKLKKIIGPNLLVKTRQELNETYYKMLNAEGLILNLVLGLILIVAMFNTVGAVIILIIEKHKNIETLYKIGAKKSQIRSVFFKYGLYLSYSGGFIGLAIGCLIVYVQQKFELVYLSGTSIPYPVVFDFSNFLIVIGWVIVVGLGGSFLSSLTLKKIKP